MKTYLTMLDEGEIEKIHEATLKLLETTGVNIDSDDVASHLASKGAKVIGNNVRFPREMVLEALGMLNHEVRYAGLDDTKSFTFPHGTTTFNSTSGYGAFYYPEPGAKRRMSTSEDLVLMAKLADSLDVVDFFWPITMPTEEMNNSIQEIRAFDEAARHTGKHIECSCSSPAAAAWQVRMAEALAGGSDELRRNPILSVVASPTTPLGFEKATAEAYPIMAKAGVPINPMNVPIAGSTAPATFAGTLLIANAEQIATLLIAKSYNPDAPVVYSGDLCAANMHTGNLSYTNPDYDLFSVAGGDIARSYGWPCCVGHGSNERKEIVSVDVLMGNMIKIAYNQTTRTDLSVWMGSADDSIATSIWDIMIDAETLKYAKAYCKQAEVNDDTLALDVIDQVGPHGEFISSEHTFEHFRDELNMLNIEDSYLLQDDGTDYMHRAYTKGCELIEAAPEATLDDDRAVQLDELMAQAREELA